MKWSKLDPMTVLMLVVAVGVVITMSVQTSVASINITSVDKITATVVVVGMHKSTKVPIQNQ